LQPGFGAKRSEYGRPVCLTLPDARAAGLCFFRVVGLIKTVEKVRQVFGGVANARVEDKKRAAPPSP
jgi:hypothetical protein